MTPRAPIFYGCVKALPEFSGTTPAPLFRSVAYGLELGANVAIPGLKPQADLAPLDLRIEFGALPYGFGGQGLASAAPAPSGVTIWVESGYYRIRYADRTEFAVSLAGDQVFAEWPDDLTPEDTATYLLGPILSLVLRLRGTFALHASAVRIGDVAVALVGPQGAGKSTTAASFAQAGFSVLTDDVAALRDDNDRFSIIPAYPRIRLWPSSVEMLFGAPDALPLLTPGWDKRYLDLGADGFAFETGPVELAAVYFLQPRADVAGAPRIEAEPTRDGLIKLIGNLGGGHILDADSQGKSFDALQRLARVVPLRRLFPHAHPARLDALRALIVADVASLNERARSNPRSESHANV